MYKRLKSFINKNDIFFTWQYGFRENCPTQHVILDILNKIQSNIDKRLYSCGIFIDLKKAFDTVDHLILLHKLHHYGIRGMINDWFSSYLSFRMQSTQIGSIVSSKERTVWYVSLKVKYLGNCEEELPKKTCRPTVGQLLANS